MPQVDSCASSNNKRARSGSPGRTRTYNLPVNSRTLYRLSYRGSGPGGGCTALDGQKN